MHPPFRALLPYTILPPYTPLQELRVLFFGALLKKDLHYWTTKKGPWHEMIGQVFHLDDAVTLHP